MRNQAEQKCLKGFLKNKMRDIERQPLNDKEYLLITQGQQSTALFIHGARTGQYVTTGEIPRLKEAQKQYQNQRGLPITKILTE